MTCCLSAETLRLLRDRGARPELRPGAHADALLRMHVLVQVADVMRGEGIRALLVKGAALSLTVYPDAAARRMSDIDMLVDEGDHAAAVHALERLGWLVSRDEKRRLSRVLLGETMVQARAGSMTFTVEVHSSLDKVVRRPIAFADLASRGLPAPGLEGLSVPSCEDHALLVALHASTHEFRHELALQDMELLLRSGLDRDALRERCEKFRLRTVMFVMLSVLRSLGAASVDDDLVQRFDPGRFRRTILDRFYDVERFPPARGEEEMGIAWVVRQAPLWDDPSMFVAGVARYGVFRGVERMLDVFDERTAGRGR